MDESLGSMRAPGPSPQTREAPDACTPDDSLAVRVARARALVGALPDPEIPVVTLADLGILRGVEAVDGRVVVTLTPTWSGCPATEAIVAMAEEALADDGVREASVRVVRAPAWTTDWITADGRERLRAYGIVPPGAVTTDGELAPVRLPAPCPQCGSRRNERLAAFGSTPCKALYRCLACREPFEAMKAI
jgi:ring-1,2-phenylacetyl-CoA epoxidase subunit PaaD